MRRTRVFSFVVFVIAVICFAAFQLRFRVAADSEGPEITMEETRITVPVEAEESALLEGISAQDRRDGDVTGSLMVEGLSNFTSEGVRLLTFAACDQAGNVTKGQREIVYSDYTPPRFALRGPLRFPTGGEDILGQASAQDQLDGDLSSQIKISSRQTFSASQAGDYQMELSVSNSAGDVVRLPVTVTIYPAQSAQTMPSIQLREYLVYTPAGTELDPWDYVEGVTVGSRSYTRQEDGLRYLSPDLAVTDWIYAGDMDILDGQVDYQTPGTYEITYQYTSDNGVTGAVRLVVAVTD